MGTGRRIGSSFYEMKDIATSGSIENHASCQVLPVLLSLNYRSYIAPAGLGHPDGYPCWVNTEYQKLWQEHCR
jgi:hypothetical protein